MQVLCIDSVTKSVNAVCPPCYATITKVNGSNGAVTFTANNAASTPGVTYTWYFGDGSSATGSPVTHSYQANGMYTAKLITHSSSVPCTDSTTVSVAITNIIVQSCQSFVSKTYGTNGAVTFTASTSGGNSGKTYTWQFGDGTSGTGNPITHTYPTNGGYLIKLVTQSVSIPCTDSSYTTAQISNKQGPCATTISPSTGSNGVVTFTANTPGGSGMTYNWKFGDNTTGTGSPVTHTYAPGTYYVKLAASSSTSQCLDSAFATVTISAPPPSPANISGLIIGDSTSLDTFKVWLIQFDSATNTLYAVDSTIATNNLLSYAQYTFINKPSGTYRVKAHQLDGPSSGTGFLPTYHYNSLYWNTATVFYYNSFGTTVNKHILMQSGTVTSGPGFIGGNVTLGANKGTSNGIPGQLMFLRDNTEKVIAMTYTDSNGDYLFSDLPLGTYSIYPEEGGYATTPATITLTGIIKGSHNVHFEKHDVMQVIVPKPTSVADLSSTSTFSVYPNPTSGVLYLELGASIKNATVSISDITGRNVYRQSLSAGGRNGINVSHLRAGQYLITVDADGRSNTQKLLLDK
jgi:hypothetical protein